MDSKKIIPKDQKVFLEILRNILHGEENTLTKEELLQQLKGLLRLSSIHMVFPLVINHLYTIIPNELERYKKSAVNQTIWQAASSASFILLYRNMLVEGLSPVVLKGIICRNLYPEPEERRSIDEDLLIKADEIQKYHQFLVKNGFQLVDPEAILEKDNEISYLNEINHLYLEVHKYPFSQDDSIFKDLNTLFKEEEEIISIPIYNTDIYTMDYTKHLLYMICHAYKHLVYCGIGIRQICDMVLFTEAYGKQIDWDKIVKSLSQLHLTVFAEALLKIATDYLGMDLEKAECSHLYSLFIVDEKPLLDDIMSGGVYGTQDENRLHSANMTLSAVSAKKQGKKNDGFWNSVFPSFAYMSHNYSYLKKNKYLLPIAWVQRIFTYLKSPNSNVQPKKSIVIGKQRIEILKKYKLL